jgi:adenosine kinase
MTALICGSMAYDFLMEFEGRFGDHILPDRIHQLNVSFHTPTMTRNFGGCAGNIAYNLKLLEGSGLIMATVGHDFELYKQWLARNQIAQTHLRMVPDQFTAQAFITKDLDNNQITAFHPGAMNYSHLNKVTDSSGVKLGIVSPDGRQGMLDHAQQFAAAGIPFIFDPGQALPLFNGEELRGLVDRATWVAFNDYEGSVVSERTGWSLEDMAARTKAVIVTRGGDGSWIFSDGKRIEIPTAPISAVTDPTGCGDAYRAGLLYGLMQGLDWQTTGRVASLMGAIKIEHPAPQQHRFTRQQFADRFRAAFGRSL